MPAIALLLTLFVLPSLFLDFNSYNYKRFIQLLILLLSGLYLLLIRGVDLSRIATLAIIATLFIGTANLTTLTFSGVNLLPSSFMAMLLTLFIASYTHFNFSNLSIYLKVILILSALSLLPLMLSILYFVIQPPESLDRFVIFSNWENRRFFNQLQVMTIPAILYFFRSSKFKIHATIILILNLFFLLFSDGRGAVLATLLTTSIYVFYSRNALKPVAMCWLTAICLLVGFTSLVLQDDYTSRLFYTSSSGRIDIWVHTITNISDVKSWLIGSGGQSLNYLGIIGHPHNSVLQVIHSWGLLGFLALCAPVLYILKRAYILRKTLSHAELALFLCMLSGGIYSMFSGVLVMPASQTLFTILLAANLKLFESKCRAPVRSYTTPKLLLFFAMLIYCFAFTSSYNYHLENRSNYGGPQFWSF